MNCKLRTLSVCAALGLPQLAAGGLLAVPTIDVTSPVPSANAIAVVFAPPAVQNPPARPILDIRLGAPAARVDSLVAPPSGHAVPTQFLPPRSDQLTPASATQPASLTKTQTDGAPAVSFAVPRYEAPVREVTALERETLAACLVLEAASQGEFGMRAVMAVIRNRAGGDPEFFTSVVLQPKQFSALNKVTAGSESLAAAIRRAKRDRVWQTALAVVDDAIDGKWHDPTGGATHYTRSAERTHWTRSLAKTTTIGAHSFYR